MKNNDSVCFVAKISEIHPIEGADKLETVTIEGWNCVVQKGNYKIDDLVVAATTDAVIPQELAEQMNVTNYLRKGNRVRTVKLRGVYSECLIIPFHYVNSKTQDLLREGDDVMKLLGVEKYEPPVRQISLGGGRKVRYSENPKFNIYYKFPNIKNVPNIFDENDVVQITRKIHGTNARYGIVMKKKISVWDRIKIATRIDKWAAYEFVAGSHNVEKGSDSQGFYDTNVWFEIAEKYKIKEKLWEFVKLYDPSDFKNTGTAIILYGEIYGAGIQKNYEYGLKDRELVCFDSIVNGTYMPTNYTASLVKDLLHLPHAPILYEGNWSKEVQDKYLLNNFIDGTKVPHEGIVIKHWTGIRSKVAKVINPDYLIYSEKHDVSDSH